MSDGAHVEHVDIEEMLGAYALDAVDGDEREMVERHLADCPRCREEVAEHREVAAQMAYIGAPAPDGLWDRIIANLEDIPPALGLAPVVPMSQARSVATMRLGRRAVAVGAAVATAAAVAIGGL